MELERLKLWSHWKKYKKRKACDSKPQLLCDVCNAEVEQIFGCEGCKQRKFCGKTCQKIDWEEGVKRAREQRVREMREGGRERESPTLLVLFFCLGELHFPW